MKKIVAGACAARLFRDDPVPDQEWSEYKPDDALKPKPKRRRRHRKMDYLLCCSLLLLLLCLLVWGQKLLTDDDNWTNMSYLMTTLK